MAFDDIEVFVEVVEAGSFTQAAKKLGIPLSTASARVARLEETLGASLLQRTTRQIRLTEIGQIYYEHGVQALNELARAQDRIGAAKADPQGILRITAPVDLAQFVLPDLIDTYLAAWPDVTVDLVVTNRKVDLIAENIDVALRVGPLEDSSLIARKCLSSEVGLYASDAYLRQNDVPETVADLADHSVLHMSISRDVRQRFLRSVDEKLEAARGRIAADDFTTARALISRGLAVGLLPGFAVSGQPDEAQFTRILADEIHLPLAAHLIYPQQRFLPPKLRAFLDLAG